MKLVILFSLLVTMNVFANSLNFNCQQLAEGNANGKAYTTAKSIDFDLTIDFNSEDADVRGTLVTEVGAYHRDGDIETLYAYFTEGKKFKQQGDVVSVTSFVRNVILCGVAMGSPCRQWESLTFNTKTYKGMLEKSHSPNLLMGDVQYEVSIKFACAPR